MAEVTMWRYELPNVSGQGHGIVILDSNGFFAAVSDYGNYAYNWPYHGCNDFREFFLQIAKDTHYFLEKLSQEDRFDQEATVERIKRAILSSRREQSMTAEQSKAEWDWAIELQNTGNKEEWYDQTDIDDAQEYFVYDYPASAKAFVTKLLPRLSVLIEEELANEMPITK